MNCFRKFFYNSDLHVQRVHSDELPDGIDKSGKHSKHVLQEWTSSDINLE